MEPRKKTPRNHKRVVGEDGAEFFKPKTPRSMKTRKVNPLGKTPRYHRREVDEDGTINFVRNTPKRGKRKTSAAIRNMLHPDAGLSPSGELPPKRGKKDIIDKTPRCHRREVGEDGVTIFVRKTPMKRKEKKNPTTEEGHPKLKAMRQKKATISGQEKDTSSKAQNSSRKPKNTRGGKKKNSNDDEGYNMCTRKIGL